MLKIEDSVIMNFHKPETHGEKGGEGTIGTPFSIEDWADAWRNGDLKYKRMNWMGLRPQGKAITTAKPVAGSMRGADEYDKTRAVEFIGRLAAKGERKVTSFIDADGNEWELT